MFSTTLDDLLMGAHFLWQLPAFLRHPVTVEEARATLKRRLENREADLLALVKRAIYDHLPSPYRALLQLAGCEYGDLERLVRQEGVEGALTTLLHQGVYLTVEEFKGRRAIVRGSSTIALRPDRPGNPLATAHFRQQTGGSRGPGAPVRFDVAFVREIAVNTAVALDAYGGHDWDKAFWGVPGGGSLFAVLRLSGFGRPVQRWFSMLDPGAPGLHPRYRWSLRVVRLGSLVAGRPLPSPEPVSINDPRFIADWLADMVRRGGRPTLQAPASAIVRLCVAADTAGIPLAGTHFVMGGEPVTAARLAVVARTGATACAHYGSVESGYIGYGCARPTAPDDVHVFHDLNAVVTAGTSTSRRGGEPLYVSSLRPNAPFILLNVSLGDQAVLERRDCGCPLGALGWATHLHTIRSFEKLTAVGMTFLDRDIIGVLDQVLPARLGGGPTDYQLVEEEDAAGHPVLRLLVHPRVGPLDAGTVSEAFLAAIGPGTGAERVMSMAWRDAKLVRVERRPPLATASGKILHLHVNSVGADGHSSAG